MSNLVTSQTHVQRAAVPAIDVHNHLGRWLTDGVHWVVPDVGWMVEQLDTLWISSVVNLDGRWGDELEANLDRYDRAYPGRFLTFCHVDWSMMLQPQFSRQLSDSLRRSVEAGAGGLKVWKSLGLDFKDAAGKVVMPDDPRLSELWATAGELGIPVLIHVADPAAFWLPVNRRNERYEELARHSNWSYSGRPVSSREQLLEAFIGLAQAHPGTNFIAAHLANAAEDLAWVTELLNAHPNVAVDLSGREAELGRQPRASKALMLRFPDRVLWGTDAFPFDAERYRRWFRLLETADENFDYSVERVPPQGRWPVSGLDLPPEVLTAVYADNARNWVPGLPGPAASPS